jgi:nitroreductase
MANYISQLLIPISIEYDGGMDIHKLISHRRSVRSWADRPVDRGTITRILETARFAPSAKNKQEWHVVVVRDAAARRRLGEECARQSFVGEAPAVLVVCGDTSMGVMRCGQPRMPVDVAIFIDHITLVAAAEGLGTCWIGSFDAEIAGEIVGVPEGWVVAQLLPLGYPASDDVDAAKPKQRKSLEEIVSWETWKNPGLG